MKIPIEYNLPGDGRKFLNFWNWKGGGDVCCEIIDGKLFLSKYDENGDELPDEEITFEKFLALVEEKAG